MSEVLICRCEEISELEISEAIEDGARSLIGVKRRTGAGMGLCQGRTCRRLITNMIVQQTGISPAEVETDTTRIPVRPIQIDSLLCPCQQKEKKEVTETRT
ncbi:MAG: domain protein (2Fe-2S)-binding domain protein [Firmicutes bacterium]|nr:domain protein (2Fe-2S)-binding domain protein [Bacillota bacterium]